MGQADIGSTTQPATLTAAARAERLDERALGGHRVAAVGAQQVDRPLHRPGAVDLEGLELATLELLGDDEPRDEADAQARRARSA